jgi:transaldolase
MPKRSRDAAGANALDQLKTLSTVVADTADFTLIEKYFVQDTTTNPAIVLAAAKKPEFSNLLAEACAYGRAHGATEEDQLRAAFEKLFVGFGVEILKIIPGRVSTEVDARLSFDEAATLAAARRLIALYEEAGIGRERVLIKVAATWEGLAAAKVLESEGVHVNATLLFGFHQAVLCAQSGVTLVSPFVARVTDYACGGRARPADGSQDGGNSAGVLAVAKIYNYFRKHGYATVVMPASLRTTEEVAALAGIDLYTMPPSLLDKLQASEETLERKLSPELAAAITDEELPKVAPFTRESWAFAHNEDECSVIKLAEGIRQFSAAARELEEVLRPLLARL